VTVVIRDSGTGISVTVEGDGSGAYSAPNLLPGRYDISARKEGFRIETVTGVQLLAQQTARVDFHLVVAGVQQSVEVQAQAQLTHTDSHTINSSIHERQLTDLPTTSRSIDGLMILAPGVTGFGNVSNISNPQISGSHYWGSTNFSLNGVSLNNFGNGSASGTQSFNEDQMGEANLLPPDALQEFRVDSGGLSAEYKKVAAVTLQRGCQERSRSDQPRCSCFKSVSGFFCSQDCGRPSRGRSRPSSRSGASSRITESRGFRSCWPLSAWRWRCSGPASGRLTLACLDGNASTFAIGRVVLTPGRPSEPICRSAGPNSLSAVHADQYSDAPFANRAHAANDWWAR
jgi:Carboxypeptidase regulatory-like domain